MSMIQVDMSSFLNTIVSFKKRLIKGMTQVVFVPEFFDKVHERLLFYFFVIGFLYLSKSLSM